MATTKKYQAGGVGYTNTTKGEMMTIPPMKKGGKMQMGGTKKYQKGGATLKKATYGTSMMEPTIMKKGGAKKIVKKKK